MGMSEKKRMKFIGRYNYIDFYEYSPTLFRPYYMAYPVEDHPLYEKRAMHRIRMLLEYLRGGYRVFYMCINNEIVGHIVVADGGRRLSISENVDIVLGPIYISPRMRGHGIATEGIRVILNELNWDYRYAYEFIMDDNMASIRTVEKNGYTFVGKAKEVGVMKRLVEDPHGRFVIYRYSPERTVN
ncbi:MAG: GNAT family N-acetyltransferase [Ruminococcaceae bacterium]|nr:GNAT family N-acetyltransferase [Oscillospiraceae bacterium]